MSEPVRTDAERLRSAEITLVTLREIAGRHLMAPADPDSVNPRVAHACGYERAMRDVITILDSRWLPEGQPVIFASDLSS